MRILRKAGDFVKACIPTPYTLPLPRVPDGASRGRESGRRTYFTRIRHRIGNYVVGRRGDAAEGILTFCDYHADYFSLSCQVATVAPFVFGFSAFCMIARNSVLSRLQKNFLFAEATKIFPRPLRGNLDSTEYRAFYHACTLKTKDKKARRRRHLA